MGHTVAHNADKAVIEALNYFSIFSYAPSTDQIHSYAACSVDKKNLEKHLMHMEKKGLIASSMLKYTGERIWFRPTRKAFAMNRVERYAHTEKKLAKVRIFFKFLSVMPYIDFAGISGSCAMHNAREKDDIDVFIISAPGGIWIARLLAICAAKVLNLHRKKGMKNISNTVCLNLFFDGGHIEVPYQKRNLYTAHEVAQIIPKVVRGGVYKKFLQRNAWVQTYFPNLKVSARISSNGTRKESKISSIVLRILNAGARKIQLPRIIDNQTTELISDQQLWFFPQDFQAKVEKHVDILPMKVSE